MDAGQKVLVALAGGVGVFMLWEAFAPRRAHAAAGGPEAGASPPPENHGAPGPTQTPQPSGAGVGTPAAPTAGGPLCRITTLSSNHLRPTATASISGPLYAPGTEVELLAMTGITSRMGSPLWHVRVPADGTTGYMFLSSAETASCPAAQ